MKILIVTTAYKPSLTGNSIDIQRISKGIEDRGHVVEVRTPTDLEGINPDIIHGFHAFKSSPAYSYAKANGIPLITTLTGTDVNEDMMDSSRRPKIEEMLRYSSAITSLNNSQYNKARSTFPALTKKLKVIKRGKPWLLDTKYDLRIELGLDEEVFIFTLIAGIRPVKDAICPIDPISELRANDIHLVFVGPILDKVYGDEFIKRISGLGHIHYLGEIPREDIVGVYSASDVLLNCSHSEGASNVIMEAMALGKPVLASDIPGNQELINDNGMLFIHGNSEDFKEKAWKMYQDKGLRESLGSNAEEALKNIINPHEIEDYLDIYRHVIAQVRL